LSKDKEQVLKNFKTDTVFSVDQVVKNPYFLEFIGLKEKNTYSETQLETAIINHLQDFLTELGRGFCFEARQKRITFDNKHLKIDLVFYHRILKCQVLIDLKIGAFDHADAGQMNVYLNYFRKNEMTDGDNPPVGIILCANKNEALVEYATTGLTNEIFVSKYQVQLPSKEVLETFIKNELKNNS
jgi:predicted nuclease of restriction endonuclease-like (RecB) superfamily